MKRTRLLLKGFLIPIFLLLVTVVSAQAPKAQLMLKNDTLLNSKAFQYDVYVRAKDTNGLTSFRLNSYTIFAREYLKNLMTPANSWLSLVSSDMPSAMINQTTPVQFKTTVSWKYVQFGGPNGAQEMTIYDAATDPLGNQGWVRMGTIRITSPTNVFPQGVMNICHGEDFVNYTYVSSIQAKWFDGTTNQQTNISFDTLSYIVNPVMNKPITAYSVTNPSGSTIQLSNSEAPTTNYPGDLISSSSVVYYLVNGTDSTLTNFQTHTVATQTGNGGQLTWNNVAPGTYIVVAHRASTYMYRIMSGGPITIAAGITLANYTVSGGGSYCAGGTIPTVNLSNSQTLVNYQLQKGGINYGSVQAGTTGTALHWNNLPDGVYTVLAIDANNATNTLAMTGNATVTTITTAAPTAGNNGPVCAGTTLSLSASTVAGATYAWTGPNGYTSTEQNPTVSGLATLDLTGTYSVIATANGCSSAAATTSVTVNAQPMLQFATNSHPCEGSALTLSASSQTVGASFSWTGPNGYSSLIQNPIVSSSATTALNGSYSVVAVLNGCTSFPMMTNVFVSTLPTAPTAGNNGPVCAGTDLSLTSSSTTLGVTYSWAGPNGFTSLMQNPDVNSSATTLMSGLYTVTFATAGGCTATATTNVTVNALPDAGSNGTMNVCAGYTPNNTELFAHLNGTPNPVGSWSHVGLVYTYTVAGTAPCANATATVTLIEQALPNAGTNGTLTVCVGTTPTNSQLFAQLGGTPNTGGSWSHVGLVYTYTVAATSPCTVPATATVTVTEQAPATPLVSVVNNCGSSTLTITNAVVGATFVWTGSLVGNPATATMQGVYSVTQTDALGSGCTSSAGSATASPVVIPAAPTGLACYQTATFNSSTCTWDITGTQPAAPSGLACYQHATWNATNCVWDVTGTQPAQPTGLACYQTATWNATNCEWVVTGTQPTQPTGLACYQTATWNATNCVWDVTGTQPAQPTGLACYQTATWNATNCEWVVTGTQPAQPTGLACYQTATWNVTNCEWVITGTQPAQPTGLACYQTAIWNATNCVWDVTGTQPAQPTGLACYQTATWNVTNCEWVITGTQPAQPTGLACYQSATWNAINCVWDVTGTQPAQPIGLACYQTATWNANTCTWDVTGTQAAAPSGQASQSFCTGTSPKVSNLIVTGTNIVWYNAATLGSVVPTTTALVNGMTYYAAQVISGCESARLAVTANVTTSNAQTLAITSSAGYWNSVSSGTSVIFTATNTGTVAPSDIQWFKNNVNTTMTGATYTYTPAEGDLIKAVVNPSTCSSGATSNVITMHIFVANTWLGTTNGPNNWNVVTNWSLGIVPLYYHDVIIPGTVTYMPTIAATGTCHNFTLLNNATFIDNNKYLYILGALEADRSLTPGKWHFIGSPVLLAYGYAFSGDNPDNGTGVNKDTLYLYKYNESTNVFTPIAVGNQEILTPGKGYEVWSTKQVTIKLKGVYGNQLQSLNDTLALTCTAPYASHGYNLVGNPFPSALDVTNSGAWEQANMSATIMTWDPVAKNYKYKIGTGITTLPGNLIPAYQGFYVVATGASPKMIIPTSAKTHGGTFYKSSIADLLHLTVNGNNYMDETFINFNSNATEGFDGQYDVEKLFGADEVPQFYSLLSDKNLAVNTLPDINSNPVVQMGFSVTVAGTYSITASELNSFVAGTSIKLEDTKLNTFTDLNAQPVYSFSADANDNVNRFKVHFGAPTGINNNNGNGGINIYSDNNIIYINNLGTEQIKDIIVYDLLGQELLRKQASNNTVNTVNMQFATAYYMVKVVTSSNVYTKKVYVK